MGQGGLVVSRQMVGDGQADPGVHGIGVLGQALLEERDRGLGATGPAQSLAGQVQELPIGGSAAGRLDRLGLLVVQALTGVSVGVQQGRTDPNRGTDLGAGRVPVRPAARGEHRDLFGGDCLEAAFAAGRDDADQPSFPVHQRAAAVARLAVGVVVEAGERPIRRRCEAEAPGVVGADAAAPDVGAHGKELAVRPGRVRRQDRTRRKIHSLQEYQVARIVGRENPGRDRTPVRQEEGDLGLVGHDMARGDQAGFADAHGAADRVEARDGEDRRARGANRRRLAAALRLSRRRRRRQREKRKSCQQQPRHKRGASGLGMAAQYDAKRQRSD